MTLYRDLKVACVLPAFNEARYIASAVRMLPRDLVDDVIVVDDASVDATRQLAVDAGADEVITHELNSGVGASIVTGFEAALRRGNDVAVVIPGDGQADLDALPRMLDKIAEGYGLVISDRISGRDPTASGMPRYRLVGSRVLAVMTWVATGLYIPDPQSGYKAVRREALQRIPLRDLYPRWGFHNDTLSYCALLGIPVTTVPAKPVYLDDEGDAITSHIRLWDLVPRHLRVFSRIARRRIEHRVLRRPIAEGRAGP